MFSGKLEDTTDFSRVKFQL